MNYRHAYHAGNFADVLKHVALCRLVEYMKRKDKAFRVIDTHAGVGSYDLSSAEAQRTGEWRSGIGRLLSANIGPYAKSLLASYLEAISAMNTTGDFTHYPGSPMIIRRLLRTQDRLSAIELHPQDASRLKKLFAGDIQVKVLELDGWLALGAHVPPKEKRGLVLIDPPFEESGEFDRLVEGLVKAYRRWPGGVYALWYPIKDRTAVADFRRALGSSGVPKIIDVAFAVRAPSHEPRLDGCGLVVVNPPYTFENEMRAILPTLKSVLAEGSGGGWRLDWLTGEETLDASA